MPLNEWELLKKELEEKIQRNWNLIQKGIQETMPEHVEIKIAELRDNYKEHFEKGFHHRQIDKLQATVKGLGKKVYDYIGAKNFGSWNEFISKLDGSDSVMETILQGTTPKEETIGILNDGNIGEEKE